MTNEVKKIVCCKAASAKEPHTTGRLSAGLPTELLSEQVRRLSLFAAVLSGMWGLAVVLELLVVPLTNASGTVNWRAIVIESIWIAISALMFAYVRFGDGAPQQKANIALIYMVVNAVGIAIISSWIAPPMVVAHLHVSWVAVLILVFAMIAPTSPRRTLIASLVAASMDPLGAWLASLGGRAVPPPASAFLLFLPSYVCAVIAVVPAKALQHLGRQIREAQDLGSYRLVELLGRGGMGEVWRAEHRLLARHAAVKLVRPEVLGSAQTDSRVVLRRFEREARATAALNSPHTIQVFDFGLTDEGSFYYVMELLSGRDLESLVRDFGPLPADRVVYLLRQICHSLADAHARGLVHRDIKPANIYACRMGLEYDFVKVLDFGLVMLRDPDAPRQTLLTMDHQTTGTPAYMAPEIILGEADVDRRADVYALGCVLYYLLTGQLVFEAETPIKMLMQHVQAMPVPPSQRSELPIPKQLDEMVLKCLEKDADKRPQNAMELLELAYSTCSCGQWTGQSSQSWWEQHLPDLTGPLTITDVHSDTPAAHAGAV